MILLKPISLLLVTATLSVKAQAVAASRFSAYCGLLQNKIYCHGGSTGTRENEFSDANTFMLDVSQASGANMIELQNNWKRIVPITANVNTQVREAAQFGTVGGTQLVVSGGYSKTSNAMVDQTIAYDARDNTWKKYPNYIEGVFGNRQIYYASSVEVPSKGLAFYGGFEEFINRGWTITANQNISAAEFNNGTSRSIGYAGLTYLDINNANNPWAIPSQTNAPCVFSALQSSVFDPVSQKIFFFGGTYEDILKPGYNPDSVTYHPFSYALSFNTVNSAWGNQTLTGYAVPTMREYHTTTLLPNGQSIVLLYGGERNEATSNDYCYTLNLRTFTWTQENILSHSIDLVRSRHNAVVVNNDTLFIINGFDFASQIVTLPIVLNISNPSSISYLDTYTAPSAHFANTTTAPNVTLSNTTQTPESATKSSGGLSTGAIVGIAVGVSVVGILALVVIIFFLRKKKAEKKKREQEIAAQQNENQESIEVNWEEIDKQYEMMPVTNKLSATYPSTPVAHASAAKYEDEHTTVIGSIGFPQNTFPITRNSVVSCLPNAFKEVPHQPTVSKSAGTNFW